MVKDLEEVFDEIEKLRVIVELLSELDFESAHRVLSYASDVTLMREKEFLLKKKKKEEEEEEENNG